MYVPSKDKQEAVGFKCVLSHLECHPKVFLGLYKSLAPTQEGFKSANKSVLSHSVGDRRLVHKCAWASGGKIQPPFHQWQVSLWWVESGAEFGEGIQWVDWTSEEDNARI